MGFVIPGIDLLRFTVAPTGTGDVHVRVSSRDGSSHDDAGEDDDATTRLSRIPPATHLYPSTRTPLDAFLGVGAAERARANAADARARAAAETAARLVDAPRRPAPPRLVWEPSAPKTTVVPILPRLDPAIVGDEWGHPTQTAPRDPNITQPPTAVGWREVALDDAGASGDSSSLARQPGAASDFVRGSLANVPFTPGGAGWETVAAEASAAREATARRASVGWLAEYEAGVFSGTPPRVRPLAVGGSARGGGGEPGRRSRSRSRRGVDARRSPPRRHPRRERRRRRVSGRGRLGRLGRLGRNLRRRRFGR